MWTAQVWRGTYAPHSSYSHYIWNYFRRWNPAWPLTLPPVDLVVLPWCQWGCSERTLLSPLQSNRAVSWCRLASEELSKCWMPTRSLCGEVTRKTRVPYLHEETLLNSSVKVIASCVCVCVCVCVCDDTSAVGNRGTANCSRPWIWICMVVRVLRKMVRGCKNRKVRLNARKVKSKSSWMEVFNKESWWLSGSKGSQGRRKTRHTCV